MRKLKQSILSVTIITVMMFLSCSSSDDGGNGGDAPTGTLVAKVDGASYQSMEISSSATIASTPTGQSLLIVASNSDGNAFSFTIFGYDGVGTYDFDGSVLSAVNVGSYTETAVNLSNPANSTTEIWQAPYENSYVGSLSVSEETDTHLKGTFEFTCKNLNGDQSVKTISDGEFNLGIQNN
ncbi:DUF6252 family protein [Winogradskyella sediminis]|uniref:Lipoprotein n=1 Tax=Winogradskyella sediminis TaxID=1382466 RepID=A0A1H1UXY4_9FLAO|nr:DUF6252 family protein [Winogradskyella sediminis]REG87548.1 hypothetical protein C8N41_102387 [Winogradskyella sediminis]SDS76699.1 hypothetical protein SAMN04489797_2370 [Winogradskyella sediminis]